ncbi:MAG: Asp-tRNA(Asn)/Glu-tRNA(Gln) amidotransferase subunit GatC [Pseudomonadota bacterium]
MSIDEATVKRIAHLARIKLDDAQVAPLQEDLNTILEFVEQLSSVDTQGVEPMTIVEDMALRQRTDEVTDGDYPTKVLANAPDAQFDFFAVPKVVE